MPGKHLNDYEKKLLKRWENPPADSNRPTLRSIEISGKTGLRGINALIVRFRYPITAICGNNGVGKSTILALSALAHHSPSGWFVHWGNPGIKRSSGDRTYYTFSDFFVYGKDENSSTDVSITWRYFQNNKELSTCFIKGKHWGPYTKRPIREVDFLPLARILPAYEMSGVRAVFQNPKERIENTSLGPESLKYLSFIMGKEYIQAEILKSKRYTFQRCNTNIAYTAFNMGGGECCLIALLNLLQRMPRGGLLVVEEIEAGLHPQAQTRLAQILIEICQKKFIQIICTTHSETFLDALPRQARLVLKKSGDEHSISESPSTRLAIYEMTGEFQPELIIYCEDSFAATLIREALPEKLRLRVTIRSVGSDVTVIRQGVAHFRSGFKMKSLCVLDGDCTDSKIKNWIISENDRSDNFTPDYLMLPGDGLVPERWIIAQFEHKDYQIEFSKQFNCSINDVQAHLEAMNVGLDHHDIGFILHRRINLDKNDCISRIIRAVAPRHPQLDGLRDRVKELLD
jgi:predicted ATPase